MYDTLSTLTSEAMQQKRQTILTGNFNAQVGSHTDGNSKSTIGHFGMESCNSRGEWLKACAGKEHFIITNTHFRKQQANITTYASPSQIDHQLDYILVTPKIWKTVTNTQSSTYPDLGSDHQAVQANMRLARTSRNKRRKQKTTTIPTWPPDNTDDYRHQLASKLDETLLTYNLDERCRQIENVMLESTRIAQSSAQHISRHRQESTHLTQLLTQ